MPITDAFTGTNGTGLPSYSANWAYTKGSAANIQIQSDAFAGGDGVERFCERTESPFPADHYSAITISAVNANNFIGVVARCQGAGSESAYAFFGHNTLSAVYDYTGGGATLLGSTAGGFAASDVVRVTVSGTTITPNKNGSTTGTPGAQTDATHANGKPGVYAYFSAGGFGTRGDSFECSNVVVLAPTITQQPGNQSVVVGDTATFTVAATTSGGTLIYDWEVDDGGGFVNASGTQTNASYTTDVLTLAEDGDIYRCNVSDDNGTAVSESATLTVELAAALANFSGITPLIAFSSDTPSRFNI